MKNVKDKKHITNLTKNTIFIFDLQMSNNCKSVGFRMQRSKDDMLGVSTKLAIIFVQAPRVLHNHQNC
jgi:hypothetical protein